MPWISSGIPGPFQSANAPLRFRGRPVVPVEVVQQGSSPAPAPAETTPSSSRESQPSRTGRGRAAGRWLGKAVPRRRAPVRRRIGRRSWLALGPLFSAAAAADCAFDAAAMDVSAELLLNKLSQLCRSQRSVGQERLIESIDD